MRADFGFEPAAAKKAAGGVGPQHLTHHHQFFAGFSGHTFEPLRVGKVEQTQIIAFGQKALRQGIGQKHVGGADQGFGAERQHEHKDGDKKQRPRRPVNPAAFLEIAAQGQSHHAEDQQENRCIEQGKTEVADQERGQRPGAGQDKKGRQQLASAEAALLLGAAPQPDEVEGFDQQRERDVQQGEGKTFAGLHTFAVPEREQKNAQRARQQTKTQPHPQLAVGREKTVEAVVEQGHEPPEHVPAAQQRQKGGDRHQEGPGQGGQAESFEVEGENGGQQPTGEKRQPGRQVLARLEAPGRLRRQ